MAGNFFLADPEFWLWLLRADLWLQNMLLAIAGRKFRVRKGRYGTQLVLRGPWSAVVRRYMRLFWIRELFMFGYTPFDGNYRFLQELPQLKALSILTNIKDSTDLYAVSRLRSLELPGVYKGFGLELGQFTELEDLALMSWFSQAQSLFQLHSLKELALERYPGKDGSTPFRAMRNLERLWLSACGLEEIENFSSLARLRDLSLLLMKHLQSLHGIEQLSKLRKLRIENCPGIVSLEPLRHLTSLESLRIIDCGKIESLEPLAALPRLGKTRLSKDGRSVIVSKQ